MSHNSKYYNKKLTKRDAAGSLKIKELFASQQRKIDLLVTEIVDDIIKNVVSTCSSHTDVCESNVVNHPTKIKKLNDSKSPSTSEFIDQRRFYPAKYETLYHWLYFSNSKGGFICKFCEMFSTSGLTVKPFVTKGIQIGTHPTRQFETHQESESHKTAMERFSLLSTNVNVAPQLRMNELKGRDKNRSIVKKIFRCVDFLIKQKWAATKNTEKLVKFVASLGVKELDEHLSTSEVKYVSSDSVTDMVKCLSDMLETDLLNELRNQDFALLADESTDLAHRSQMSIMARFGSDNKPIQTYFLGFAQLTKMDAETIMHVIETFLVSKGVSIEKVRFMGFDGCNTMSGERTGLQRRIRHVSPFAVYINCRNHRLALCLTHLIKRFEILQDLDSTLLALWKLYEFSPQKLAVFKHVQTVYGKTEITIVRAATTRWLSHMHASSRFISRYECIVDSLDTIYKEKREPEVYGIRLAVTNKQVVATILLLTDILKPIDMLSLYLQAEHINFTSLPEHVKTTIDSLTDLIEIYQGNLDDLQNTETEFSKCEKLFTEINERTELGRRLRMNQAIERLTPREYFEKTGIPLIYDLIQEIQDAFVIGEPALTAFSFFNPVDLPDTVGELAEYGKSLIERLVRFYASPKTDKFKGHTVNKPPLMDPVQLEVQLKSFKMQLFMMRRNRHTTVTSVWDEFRRDAVLKECFPLVYQLYYYCMIIPSSTAVVERSFSLMGNLLTAKRNRLTQTNLDATMRICHRNEDLTNADLEKLVDMFKGLKDRKMNL